MTGKIPTSMTITAAVLFVQNDCDDIGWWIAYHLAVGFDTLVIYDDHSTDGTWEIIQAASRLYSVQAHRVSSEKKGYADRRSDSFSEALEVGKNRFNWMICLESDEYVLPETDPTIGVWLERFSNADAITLHWSIFGSNHHVARTRVAPIAAYTQRAPHNFADHQLGKSFIRPNTYQGHPVDALHWQIEADRHVTGDGQRFDPHGPACWHGARLLHYVTRNMSHYKKRLARLPSTEMAPDLWSHFNRNDEEDLEAMRFLDATRGHAARIARACLDTLYWRISEEIRKKSPSFLPESIFSIRNRSSPPARRPLAAYRLEAEDGTILVCNILTHKLKTASKLNRTEVDQEVLLVAPLTNDASALTGCLMLPSGIDMPVQNASVLTHWLPVVTETMPGSTLLTLRSPLTGNYLGHDTNGQLSPESEEALPLKPLSTTTNRSIKGRIRPWEALSSHGSDFRSFCLGVDLLRTPDSDALACAIAHLTPEAQTTLDSQFPGCLPVWLTIT